AYGVNAVAPPSRRRRPARVPCAWCARVPVALKGRGGPPSRITFDGHARGADHLVRRQIQRHVVRRELAVELPRRIQRMRLPPVPVVHHDFRIPLREVEAPPPPPLAPRQR